MAKPPLTKCLPCRVKGLKYINPVSAYALRVEPVQLCLTDVKIRKGLVALEPASPPENVANKTEELMIPLAC